MSFASHSNDTNNVPDTGLSAACEKELLQMIRTRTGIVVQNHQLDNLGKTVATAMQHYGHSQCESFMGSLRSKDNSSPEMEFLVAGITVGESYFFRDEGQMQFLREQYLPELIARRSKTGKHLRIWSAGCSGGQEIYTLAFMLRELIPDLENWNLHLLGTDINTETLASCLRGHYREWSFRNTTDSLRERYFHVREGDYVLRKDVHDMARFTYLNLAEDAPSLLTDTNAMDLILCRNVFIYLDQPVVESVLDKFMRCLVPDGVLMLGASDLVNNNVPGMELLQDKKAFYYRRRTKREPVAPKKSPLAESSPSTNIRSTNGISNRKPVSELNSKLMSTLPVSAVDPLHQIREYLAQEQWQAVDEAVNNCLMIMETSAELLRYKATAAANLGNLEQALKLCEQALELDSVDKHTHFLSAIVLMELEQSEKSEEALKKVLFLDAKFLEAHYQLGLLQMRCGSKTKGIKSLKNALKLAEEGKPEYNLHGARDTSFERMAEMLRKEISVHETYVQVESR